MHVAQKADRDKISPFNRGASAAALVASGCLLIGLTPNLAIAHPSTSTSQLISQTPTGHIGEADRLLERGWEQMKASQFQAAIAAYEQALSIAQINGSGQIEADALMGIGVVYALLGEHYQSIDFQQQALSIYQSLGHRNSAADALQSVADSYWAIGNYPLAEDCLRQTLSIYQQLNDYAGEQYILGLLDQLMAEQF